MPNPPRQVTIAQVAEYAGVSQASVSRVLNRNQTVDPAISAKVRDAIEKLNYSPSQMARNLVRGRSNTVALVVPDLENPMFQGVLKGLSAARRPSTATGCSWPTPPNASPTRRTIAVEARSRCDALVLVSPRMPAERLEALLARSGPDRRREPPRRQRPRRRALGRLRARRPHPRRASRVARPLAHRVPGRARRRPTPTAFAGADSPSSSPGHGDVEVLDIAGGSQVEDGYRAAEDVLSSGATAVIAFNDLVALGLLARLRELGVDVPGEISVTGIDDIPLAQVRRARAHDDVGAARRARRPVVAPPARRDGRLAGDASALLPRDPRGRAAAPAPPPRRRAGSPPGRPLLRIGDHVVARYEEGTSIDSVLSPRPFLHPVETLGGVRVTDSHPTDHLHHFGIGVALPDVNGTSYWGGRTYVQDVGSIMLENQGVAAARRPHDRRRRARRTPHLDRRARGRAAQRGARAHRPARPRRRARRLDPRLALARSPRTSARCTLGSPATNGREGAGYGGLFWRFPRWDATVITRDGDGEAVAHGSRSPWLAVVDAGAPRHGAARAARRVARRCPGSPGSTSTSASGPPSRGTRS